MSTEATAVIRCHAGTGARYVGHSRCSFELWAPEAHSVDVHVVSPIDRIVPLQQDGGGYFYGEIENIQPGARYFYRLDGLKELPDPASRFQPEGVHGPSEVVASEFRWTDQSWTGIPLQEYILYELHVGTFSPAGTFDGVIERLDYLNELGITAIELMPVAQFPGSRNWGYDGAYPFAVQASYGGPAGLKRLVDAAHAKGIAVVLDVVYNHLGPEGSYLAEFGNYFTDRYSTPWGQAINFDGQGSDAVRRFFIDNALQWITEFHIDALRLDAVHAIFDSSEPHILSEIADTVRNSSPDRHVHVFAESDLNDVCVVTPPEQGGYGADAQWNDDFHHALHSLLTSEVAGYYEDFGNIRHLAKAYQDGYVYTGQYSAYRGCSHGTCSKEIPAERFIAFTQNHDQVGNRMFGERLAQLVYHEELKLAAASLLLSPFVPMLFMGQEYAESSPFLYFVDHSDPDLIEAVQQGRRREFRAYQWRGEVPDPQAYETFMRSKLRFGLDEDPHHRSMYDFYRELLQLRKSLPALRNLSKEHTAVHCMERECVLVLHRWCKDGEAVVALNFSQHASGGTLPLPTGAWRKVLDSADTQWLGPGRRSPDVIHSAAGSAWINLPRMSASVFVQTEEE